MSFKPVTIGVSTSGSPTQFQPILCQNFEDFKAIVTKMNWSPSTYRSNYRKRVNFQAAEVIGLDVDSGCSLQEARGYFSRWQYFIFTTRNHQKAKHGLVCDRFRVILPLSRKVESSVELETIIQGLLLEFPFLDGACKDCCRLFYPSIDFVAENPGGELLSVEQRLVKKNPESTAFRGKLALSTQRFIKSGAPKGHWNVGLYKAAVDYHEQRYSKEEFLHKARNITGELDFQDLKTIDSAFSKEPRHPARGSSDEKQLAKPNFITPMELMSDLRKYLEGKELVKGQSTFVEGLDVLLGGGKRLGEVTALCAEGKTGKNTVWHWLQFLMLENKVPFAYASRELNPATEVLPDYISMKFECSARKELFSEDYLPYIKSLENLILFTMGRGHIALDELEDWILVCKEKGINYFFIDHLHWCLEDADDWKQASELSRFLKDIAVNLDIHIDVIIQPKLLMEGQKPGISSMRGGSAIGQNIDNLLTLERKDKLSILTLKAARSRLAQLGHIYFAYDRETLKLEEVNMENMQTKTEPRKLELAVISERI